MKSRWLFSADGLWHVYRKSDCERAMVADHVSWAKVKTKLLKTVASELKLSGEVALELEEH